MTQFERVVTLHSFNTGSIEEVVWERPHINPDEVVVETKLCGFCRSDVGSVARFEAMPYSDAENPNGKIGGLGHEGLGVVVEVGDNVTDIKVGDVVSTWGDPAFAYKYNVKANEAIQVPEVSPKYILQPTACSINIAMKTIDACSKINSCHSPKILLLGTGFMSLIIGQYFKNCNIQFDVVGSANKRDWHELYIQLKTIDQVAGNQYDAVIDLTSKAANWDLIADLNLLKPEGILCYASTPYTPVTTNFFKQCWNCYTIIMPSPRNSDFDQIMRKTALLIRLGAINPAPYWTKGYARSSMDEVLQAFTDGLNRTPDYIRGYIDYTK
jgi:D-arabinose 1-dehydrogenase-like Zn-dependent alcohol dehydrogenase